MFRWFALMLVLAMPLVSIAVHADVSQALVSATHLDTATEQASSQLAADDPNRAKLLQAYNDTRVLLVNIDQQERYLNSYSGARINAFGEAEDVRQATAALIAVEKQTIIDSDSPLKLVELEQLIRVDKAELAAVDLSIADLRASIGKLQGRPLEITARLTQLGSQQAELEDGLGLMRKDVQANSLEEARLWLANAQVASARAEKLALEAELLSQPMRLELLQARLNEALYKQGAASEHLLSIEQQALLLRQLEAKQVLAETESAQAEAVGKHPLVQLLAEENAALGVTLQKNSVALEDVRAGELQAKARARKLESELTTVERKLEILGMTKTVGEILREQSVLLPGRRVVDKELRKIAHRIADSSLRQIDLEEEVQQLRDIDKYVTYLSVGLKSGVAAELQEDLGELARKRRELVSRSIDFENTYGRALSDYNFTLHRLEDAVAQYRSFISERLLWIQSRDPVSLALLASLPLQLAEVFSPSRWSLPLAWLAGELMTRPVVLLSFALVLALVFFTPRMTRALVATGHSVGFVRNDSFVETFKALLLSIVLALKWPLLMLAIAWPLGRYELDSSLGDAMYAALSRTALYLFGLQFLSILLQPRGLVEAHFRWPAKRLADISRRLRRFARIFLPAIFLAVFSVALYPTEVGGAMGTLAIIAILLGLSHLFSTMPHFVQDKMEMMLAEPRAKSSTFWAKFFRLILTWLPLLMAVAVVFGYSYTAIEFCLLLIQTLVVFSVLLLLHEFGLRWLRLTRRRLRLKVQEDLMQSTADEADPAVEETLEQDPELFDNEGTKFLNALLLTAAAFGIILVWADVLPALGILDSVELWHRAGVVDGQDALVAVTLSDVFVAIIIGTLGWVAIRRIPNLLEILLRQKMEVTPASAYAIATVVQYTLTTIIVVAALSMLGGDWSQIQWAVAALSVGIGFGLQEIVANFVSGLIILFEQPIRVGDTVTVGESSGVVTRIRMRATTIRDWDKRELLVPNTEFITGRLLNWSLTDKINRLHLQVGVAYDADVKAAMEVLMQSARDHELVLTDPAPIVSFDEFGDSSLLISLRCYIEELDKRISTSSSIRLEIHQRFKDAGIEVAYPQRDVHLDSKTPLDIRVIP